LEEADAPARRVGQNKPPAVAGHPEWAGHGLGRKLAMGRTFALAIKELRFDR